MKDKIRQLLLAAGENFVSGQEMCEQLGVSRTAIWKAISQLRAEGYEIEAVTNKGYRLRQEETDVLSQETLDEAFHTRWAGHPLIYKKETGSSNDDIMILSEQGYGQGTLVITSRQTAGKGRRGREWKSPMDGNVYMSILLKPAMRPEKVAMVTLVMALATYEACMDLEVPENVQFGIKWPNDIVVSVDGGPYKKLCGILTEMRLEESEIKDVTIGIGLNCNMKEIPEELKETATTIGRAIGRTVKRASLVADCWRHFEDDYERYEEAESLEPLRTAYEAALVNRGRRVRVLDPKGEYDGTAQGITSTGELIVVRDDGETVTVGNGEISVRGVMGYV